MESYLMNNSSINLTELGVIKILCELKETVLRERQEIRKD